jgi:hypothetical protein
MCVFDLILSNKLDLNQEICFTLLRKSVNCGCKLSQISWSKFDGLTYFEHWQAKIMFDTT